jgi:hypothetical protein
MWIKCWTVWMDSNSVWPCWPTLCCGAYAPVPHPPLSEHRPHRALPCHPPAPTGSGSLSVVAARQSCPFLLPPCGAIHRPSTEEKLAQHSLFAPFASHPSSVPENHQRADFRAERCHHLHLSDESCSLVIFRRFPTSPPPSPLLVAWTRRRRWVGPREEVLNIPIAYWCYGPSKPSRLLATEVGFTPTALMVGLGEKLDTDLWIGQPSCYGLGWEPFFLRGVALSIVVDDFMKDCYTQTMRDTYGLGPYTDHAWKACGMLVRFSPTRCISVWIAVTLGYEYRLFVAVITQIT